MIAALAGAIASPGLAAGQCTIKPIAELPVTMSDLQPLVPLKINGKEAWFLLDSGAFYSVITPGTAAERGLPIMPMPVDMTIRGVGGSVTPSMTIVKSLGLAQANFPNAEFIVGGSEVGSSGVVGQNILSFADIEYDFADGVVRLVRETGCDRAVLAYWRKPGDSYSMLPIEVVEKPDLHTAGRIEINGQQVRAAFDTGASLSMLSLRAAARAGIHPTDKGVVEAGETSGIGRRWVKTWIAPVASIKLGDGEEVRATRLRIADIDLGDVDMLIGADFFLAHRVYVSNRLHRMFFTYLGGKVFNLEHSHHYDDGKGGSAITSATASATAGTPEDADVIARRAAAEASRDDLAGALRDYDHACALAPKKAPYFFQRALVQVRRKDKGAAEDDLDKALAIDPDLVDARLARAELRLSEKNQGALEDALAADKSAAKAADMRLDLGELFIRLDRFDDAVAQITLWTAAHPDDSRMPLALNGRCWARALGNQDLALGQRDCDRALRLRPKAADVLDSRGLIELRQGALDRALADYDAALAISPHLAWSLYGRALIEQREGHGDAAKADIAAAKLASPGIADRFERFQIKVPAA